MKKLIKIGTLIFAMFFIVLSAHAQESNKDVTITSSGSGKTMEDAKQNALRNAIEQAFGTFISSNTEILNDELVKDEITSISSGNIQNYKVLSEVKIPDGGFATTLIATVSVTKLNSFVESKGIIVEFKGNILAANIKQQILNEQNEIKTIQNIAKTCKKILDLSCDYSIVRGQPKQNNNNNNWTIPININVKFNNNIENFNQYLYNSINGIAMSQDEISQYRDLGKKTYKIALGGLGFRGITNSNDSIKSLISMNPNLSFQLINVSQSVSTLMHPYYISDIFDNGFIKKRKEIEKNYRINTSIEYYDKTINSIFHFRTLESVIEIINLLNHTKNSVINFQIYNGLELISPKINKNSFKIIIDNLNPIFNSYNNRYVTNRPGEFFGEYILYEGLYGRDIFVKQFYNPLNFYYPQYYFNGEIETGRNGDDTAIKYRFIYQVLRDFPGYYPPPGQYARERPAGYDTNNIESNNGFFAVISLFDYNKDRDILVSLLYEDNLNLADIEKVHEYKIIPIYNN